MQVMQGCHVILGPQNVNYRNTLRDMLKKNKEKINFTYIISSQCQFLEYCTIMNPSQLC